MVPRKRISSTDKRPPVKSRKPRRRAAGGAVSGEFVSVGAEPMPPRSRDVIVLPRADYERLLELAENGRRPEPAEFDEDRADNVRADGIRANLAVGRDETISDAELGELLDAPTPLRFWRRRRGLTQAELAAAAGTAQSHISAIEKGDVGPSFETMRRIADTLKISLDDLAR